MLEKLKSRKLAAALVSVLLIVFNSLLEFGITDDQMTQVVGVVVFYLVSQGFVDAKK